VRDAWAQAIAERRIVTCSPIAMEVLYSARSLEDFEDIDDALTALRFVAMTDTAARSARAAMHTLAATAPRAHRLPPMDYLVAALAEEAGVAVLHYDQHFDRLATVLSFDSVWLAPRGSLP